MDNSQWTVGGRLLYQVSPKTDIVGQIVRTQLNEEDPTVGDSVFWTGQVAVGHNFSQSLTGRLIYSYQKRDGGVVGNSFEENMVILTIQKQFR